MEVCWIFLDLVLRIVTYLCLIEEDFDIFPN